MAISSTRVHMMIAGDLRPDPGDFQIIRFNNCIQCLACICHTLAIFIRDLRAAARLVDLFAHIVFACTAGCMAGQIHREVRHRKLEILQEDSLMAHPVDPHCDHSVMDAPGGYAKPPEQPPALPSWVQPPTEY